MTVPSRDAGTPEWPLIIGHRGTAGYRPDHTLAGYRLAIAMGADFIEPDLVATRDGVLIARHEPEIGLTTDAADKFPERRTVKSVDGVEVDGWFASDFTLAEIKTLRARQPLPFRNTGWDGRFDVPTFDEVLDLARAASAETGRPIGVYPETKHPTFHERLGLSLEPGLLAALERIGWTGPEAPVFIQSFETANLKAMTAQTGVRLIQLMERAEARPFDLVAAGDPRTYGDLMAPAELAAIAGYAFGIGPSKRTIVPAREDGSLLAPTTLIADAHAVGLRVHPYTFRDEPRYLAPDYANDPEAEYRQFFDLGVDGLFTDNADSAVRARAEWARGV